MIETTAIRTINKDPFMVIWDIGRRCNYDCSYCEATRHNNYSKHKSLDELKDTFNFVLDWTDIQNSVKKNKSLVAINFTGGEPTANPVLWEFVDYIKSREQSISLSLTSNGAWGSKYCNNIIKNFDHITVSYHAEAHENLKKLVIENILTLKKAGISLQVNVMLHVDYWEETVNVYNLLKDKGIKAKPRPIGDGNIVRKGWFLDTDGTMRRSSHEYTPEQQSWFFNEMGINNVPGSSAEGNQFGRACCGGRCLEGKVDGQWKPINFINTNFKNWHCMIDKFFLFIDQETREVYHHQTCKALPDKQIGSLGKLDNSKQLLADLSDRLSKDITIICPNDRCGCGMCIPKAQDLEDFNELKKSILATA